ncbi:TldD/PmbA family protein [Candidatus Bathyarchaeota archaeon]|nr:TldD/PmbA family protein [Candidatus Bathyarchaeota archaeon]
MDEDLVEYALDYARSKRIEYAEVRAHTTRFEQLVIKNGTLDAFISASDSGFSVRILADGGIGFASTNKWTENEARIVVDKAYKFATVARRKDRITFADEKGVKARWGVKQKKKIEDVPPEQKIEELMEIDKRLASQKVKVPGRIISCPINLIEKYFVNSEGSAILSFTPKIAAFAFITVIEDGRPEQAYKQFGRSGGWEAFDEWNVADALLNEAYMLQRLIKEGKTIKPQKIDLVCGTEITGIASHESCGHPMEADRILGREMSQAGRSFIYPGGPYWIGTRIGSDLVSIVDDPTIENSYGYYEYDDEGIRATRRYLYKDGRINEFLHNRETAAKLSTRSNGSSRSNNYDREAIVRMANTYLLPQDWTEEGIIEDVKHGIYMKSFTEWNIDDRRFNQRYVGREAYLIENGELRHPVARPVIETTTEGWWSAVDAISKKIEFDAATCGKGDPMQGIPVFTGGPIIRLRSVYVK